jgi:putative ABC transport system permease protein
MMKRFFRRLLSLFTNHRAEHDLAREMASHLALLEEEHRRRGVSPEDARLAARRAMGSVSLAKDLHRDARSFGWVDDARGDLRFALRSLVRSPGFASVVVFTMALSIGATTTLFSLAYGVLLRPLPWPDSGRLVRLEESRGGQVGRIPWTITNATYLAWREQPSTIEEIGGWTQNRPMTLSDGVEPVRLAIGSITPSLLRVLRATPEVGRTFLDSDAGRAQARALILSHGLWQRRFGGRADIVGQVLPLDGQPYTVVGVMPRTFSFPTPDTEAWTPLAVAPVNRGGGVIGLMIFQALARLRTGATPEQAAAEATVRARSAPDLKQTAIALFGTNGAPGVVARPALDVMTAEVRPALTILLAAVGLLLVASSASLIVLQLARVARRRREIAVRVAIGAGTARLFRQWLVESVVLGAAGTLSGLLTAFLLHRGLPMVLPAGFPRVDDVRLDWRVAAFACGVAMLVSLACGLVTAFCGRRDELVSPMREGSGATPPVVRTPAARIRTVFMAAQVAVACILLVGASLLVRSFVELLDADRGFDPSGLLTMRVPVPAKTTFSSRRDMLDRLQERLHALPGVTDVAYGNALPFVSPGQYRGMNLALPRDPSTPVEVQAMMRAVSPEYFRTMRLRVAQGRPLDTTDTDTSSPVIVVNRTFARRYLDDRALGQRLDLQLLNRQRWEVVGVVDDMRQGSNRNEVSGTFGGVLDPPLAEIFVADRQWQFDIQDVIVVVRTTGDPAALAADARALIRAEDPLLPVDSIMTMEDRVAGSLAGPRSYAVFLMGFAICALAIAGVGLFGVLSYTTAQRTREIGVRTTLGAQRADVLKLVSEQAVVITAGGLTAGLIAAFFLSRSLSSLIYGVSARDPVSFVVVPLALMVVALAACAVPAWRATRVDPLVALRTE